MLVRPFCFCMVLSLAPIVAFAQAAPDLEQFPVLSASAQTFASTETTQSSTPSAAPALQVAQDPATASCEPAPPLAEAIREPSKVSVFPYVVLDFGVGYHTGPDDSSLSLFRTGPGVIFAKKSRSLVYAATWVLEQHNFHGPIASGPRVGVFDTNTLLWAAAEAFLDSRARWGGSIGGGWAVLGIELQYKAIDNYPPSIACLLTLNATLTIAGTIGAVVVISSL